MKRLGLTSNSLYIFSCLIIAMGLSSCGGSSSGGNVTALSSEPDSQLPEIPREPAILMVDGDSGSDSNTIIQATFGGGSPWKSIQHALDQALPGDTIRILAATEPYSGSRRINAIDPAGIVVSTSGESGKPITLEGIPDVLGNKPVIDQGRNVADAVSPVAGLLLHCVHDISIRGFEIRRANDAGITTSLSGCDHHGLIIEDNTVHDITGVGYVAGIRLVQTHDSVVQNNHLHSITASATLSVDDPVRLIDSVTSIQNNSIQHNTIDNVDAAVHIRGHGPQPLTEHRVVKNRIHNTNTGLLLTADATNPAAISNTTFTGNLIYAGDLVNNNGRAVDVQLGTLEVQSNSLDLSRNTIVDIDQPFRISGMTEISINENIVTEADSDLLLTVVPQISTINNQLTQMDNNLYFDNGTTSWVLGRGASFEFIYASLITWQHAFSISSHPEITADPDLLSLQADPQFINKDQQEFSLLINSPARTLGANGGQIGAYYDDIAPGNL